MIEGNFLNDFDFNSCGFIIGVLKIYRKRRMSMDEREGAIRKSRIY